jgi:hypothetical protein
MDRYAQMSDIPFERIKALEQDAKTRSHCDILLFRSVIKRLDNLEVAQNLRQQDEDTERAWTPAPQTPEQVSAGLREAFRESQGTSNDRQIRSSLVERVETRAGGDARAAIREVAKWLDDCCTQADAEEPSYYDEPTASDAVRWLREEADR